MSIVYEINLDLKTAGFIDILKRSTLAKRRPIENEKQIEGMLKNSDLIITARDKDKIVGVARAVTDFHYSCYLSDLAVDVVYQKRGIGKSLIKTLQEQLEEACKIILLSAPNAQGYYSKIGFEKHPSAWVLSSTYR